MPGTNPQPATSSLLSVLTSVNAELSLGMTIGNTVIPIIVGIVKNIKSAASGPTVEYTVVLQSENAILDSIITSGAADIATINAELAKFGFPALAVPGATAPTP